MRRGCAPSSLGSGQTTLGLKPAGDPLWSGCPRPGQPQSGQGVPPPRPRQDRDALCTDRIASPRRGAAPGSAPPSSLPGTLCRCCGGSATQRALGSAGLAGKQAGWLHLPATPGSVLRPFMGTGGRGGGGDHMARVPAQAPRTPGDGGSRLPSPETPPEAPRGQMLGSARGAQRCGGRTARLCAEAWPPPTLKPAGPDGPPCPRGPSLPVPGSSARERPAFPYVGCSLVGGLGPGAR